MRETFRGYYRPTDAEFSDLWKKCIFCFDANILLNIYRYSPDTKKKFIRILEKVSDRIIIPYQAAKEYQNNRLSVINEQEEAYDKVVSNLQDNLNKIENDLNSFKKHPFINVKDIIEGFKKVYGPIKTDLNEKKKNHPNLFTKDELRDEITELLDGKIGDPCPDENKDKLKEKCKFRFENEIPPGFKDSKKKENKCGDMILWFQLLKIAEERKLPIIFITDEKKDDWWWTFNGKTIGPRPELIDEMYNRVQVQFYMYKTDQFIKFAEKQLFKQDADPKFIEEVKDVMIKDSNFDNYGLLPSEKVSITSEGKIEPLSLRTISKEDLSYLEFLYSTIVDQWEHIQYKKQVPKSEIDIIKKNVDLINYDFQDRIGEFRHNLRMEKSKISKEIDKLTNLIIDPEVKDMDNLILERGYLRNKEEELNQDMAQIQFYHNKFIVILQRLNIKLEKLKFE